MNGIKQFNKDGRILYNWRNGVRNKIICKAESFSASLNYKKVLDTHHFTSKKINIVCPTEGFRKMLKYWLFLYWIQFGKTDVFLLGYRLHSKICFSRYWLLKHFALHRGINEEIFRSQTRMEWKSSYWQGRVLPSTVP